MRTTVIFVFLEYLIGLGFAIAGVFIFSRYDRSSLMNSIFYGLFVCFISMFIGIGLVGYFHLKTKLLLNRFGWALFYTFIGIFLSVLLYLIVASFIASYLGIFIILLPVTGGVMGFNWTITK